MSRWVPMTRSSSSFSAASVPSAGEVGEQLHVGLLSEQDLAAYGDRADLGVDERLQVGTPHADLVVLPQHVELLARREEIVHQRGDVGVAGPPGVRRPQIPCPGGRQLGKNGPTVTSPALGGMRLSGSYGAVDDEDGVRVIHAYLDAGGTLIDTGDFYGAGHNEILTARALRERDRDRDDVVLSVKFGALLTPVGMPAGFDGRPEAVRSSLTALCSPPWRRSRPSSWGSSTVSCEDVRMTTGIGPIQPDNPGVHLLICPTVTGQ